MGIMSMKKYKDDYEIVVSTDDKGREIKKPVYRGDYFEVSLDENGLRQFKRQCLLLVAAIAVFHIPGGFVGNGGMYQFYISLPYVFVFLALFNLAEGSLRLPKEKRKYRRDEVGLSFERIKTASNILMILLGIGILGEIIFLLFFSVRDQIGLEFLYLLLEVLAAAAAYFLIRLQRPILVQPATDQEKE
jgi:hypothetical protein